MKKSLLMMTLAMTLGAAGLAAGDDIDLPVNGDFRGAPSGNSPAPGWTLTADGGGARILPTTDANDFSLELRATPNQSQSVVSDAFTIAGGQLKIELKLRGTGTASFGYEALDASMRAVVAADRQTVPLSAYDQEMKRYFVLNAPNAKYIRIRLTAGAGAVALFRDVDADMLLTPAPAVVAAPAPAVVAAPAPAVVAAPAPAVSATVPAVTPPPQGTRLLQDDSYYTYTFLDNDTHFETAIPAGSDIDFELGEDAGSRLYWTIASYNPAICRVKMKHEQDGIFPFRIDKAEIELKALKPGKTDVILVCGAKRITVHFTALPWDAK